MNRYRSRLPLQHPLVEVFFGAIQSVTTSMSDSSKGRYRTTAEYFLHYLNRSIQASGLSINCGGTRTFWAG